MNLPEELRYTREHEWVSLDGSVATVGITDYAQSELGDVVYLELPDVGQEVKAAEPLGTIEAVKTVTDLYAPVSGKVRESNGALADKPELVNSSPYGEGWMVRIEMSDQSEMEKLMTAKQYREMVEGGSK